MPSVTYIAAMYVEVRWPLGMISLMPVASYLALPSDAVATTRARLVSRAEVIAMLARLANRREHT